MAKDGLIEMKAKVVTLLPNATFKVVLVDNGHEMIAYTSGKMRKNRIRVLVGDEVTVEFSPNDITRGRVTFRSSGSHEKTVAPKVEEAPPSA